jgi:hypothetical protein
MRVGACGNGRGTCAASLAAKSRATSRLASVFVKESSATLRFMPHSIDPFYAPRYVVRSRHSGEGKTRKRLHDLVIGGSIE